MSIGEAVALVVAGVGGGLCGTIAGIASLVSYPALLAVGLPATTANVTNTVSMIASTAGAVAGSGPELAGRWPHAGRLAIAGAAGGVTGGVLLLVTPEGSFERLVPWLIAAASVAILVARRVADSAVEPGVPRMTPGMVASVVIVTVYGGYFGAGAGTMLLALFLHLTHDSMPRCNAVKSVVLGGSNAAAAVAFALFGDVQWSAALPLSVGLLVGSRIGPVVVRHSPVRLLRGGIAALGLALAVKLGVDAYT